MKKIKGFGQGLLKVLSFIAFLLVLLLISPWIYIKNKIWGRKLRKKIKAQLKEFDGKIVFLYGEYHTFDFVSYFQEHHPEIICFEVPNHPPMDPFITYLNARNPPKSLPQLAKIIDEYPLRKVHYNSFKYYVRRKKDVDSFYELIERSIKNLKEV